MKQGSRLNSLFIICAAILTGLAILAGAHPAQAAQTGQDFDCSAQASIPESECLALAAIYTSTQGDSWNDNSGWLQNPDPCTWFGVSCADKHVLSLDLPGNNLQGSLPDEIADLSGLRTITINDNALSGSIPETITQLPLQLIHFHNTSLCEPEDVIFKAWLENIVYRLTTGVSCASIELTATPTTDPLLWPQQTLTALAVQPTQVADNATDTPEATATKYYTMAKSPTPITDGQAQNEGQTGATGSAGESSAETPANGTKEQSSSLIQGIPNSWLWLLLVPVGLIGVGVFLEMRERRKSKSSSDEEYY